MKSSSNVTETSSIIIKKSRNNSVRLIQKILSIAVLAQGNRQQPSCVTRFCYTLPGAVVVMLLFVLIFRRTCPSMNCARSLLPMFSRSDFLVRTSCWVAKQTKLVCRISTSWSKVRVSTYILFDVNSTSDLCRRKFSSSWFSRHNFSNSSCIASNIYCKPKYFSDHTIIAIIATQRNRYLS